MSPTTPPTHKPSLSYNTTLSHLLQATHSTKVNGVSAGGAIALIIVFSSIIIVAAYWLLVTEKKQCVEGGICNKQELFDAAKKFFVRSDNIDETQQAFGFDCRKSQSIITAHSHEFVSTAVVNRLTHHENRHTAHVLHSVDDPGKRITPTALSVDKPNVELMDRQEK